MEKVGGKNKVNGAIPEWRTLLKSWGPVTCMTTYKSNLSFFSHRSPCSCKYYARCLLEIKISGKALTKRPLDRSFLSVIKKNKSEYNNPK